jgi:uncharacterized protein YdeI (YjbR/CyaY-like superfamily)
MNPQVDTYLIEGCGRCDLYRTPQCKVHNWPQELAYLRRIVLECGLTEEYKWSQPCYTFQGNNVLIVTAFKDYATISFFKGSLLKDPENHLVKPGESSQAARQLRFTDTKQIEAIEPVIKAFIFEAIKVEKAGLKVEFKKDLEPMPEELEQILAVDEELKTAFEALTPGRQRGYILYFSKPKQAKTRISRIEKCIPKILNGEGLNDKYSSRRKS